MKKYFALFTAIALIFCLCACSEIPTISVPEETTAAVETVQPAATPEPTPEPTPAPEDPAQVIVNITDHKEERYAPDDEELLILDFAYETVNVYVEGNPEASEKINNVLYTLEEQFYSGNDYGDGYSDGFNGYYEMALDNYGYYKESGNEINVTIAAERSARVAYIGDNVLSIVFSDYSYTGGAHGNYGDMAYIFDITTGERLTLDAVSSGLADYLIEKILEKAKTDEYKELLYDLDDTENYLRDAVAEGKWYFDKNGLTVFANPYEIGPYAAGIISFDFPYSEIAEYVKTEYMPVERELSAELKLDTATESSVIIDRVVESEEGTTLMLTVSGAASNVKVCKVLYYDLEESSAFYETNTLWYCSFLRDCAVQLVVTLPEGMPDTMVSYSDSQGEHRYLLSQSGQDGSYILVDDTIQSVG